jgi:hypothetical protein
LNHTLHDSGAEAFTRGQVQSPGHLAACQYPPSQSAMRWLGETSNPSVGTNSGMTGGPQWPVRCTPWARVGKCAPLSLRNSIRSILEAKFEKPVSAGPERCCCFVETR